MTHHIKLLGHNTQRKKVKMSRDLISSAYQVLSSNELEIQELVQRISSARYLDEETKEKIINELSAALLGRAADKADKKGKAGQAHRLERGEKKASDKEALAKNRAMAAKHGQVRQGIPPSDDKKEVLKNLEARIKDLRSQAATGTFSSMKDAKEKLKKAEARRRELHNR